MLSHGFISGALFLCVGVIYDRTHTREIKAYRGLVHRMPVYATIFMLFTMGNVGLPGTSGFVGEFLTLMGAFQANTWAAFFATSGVILSACYALWLYKRVIFGAEVPPVMREIADVNRRELAVFAPLIVGTLLLGVYPSLATDVFGPSVAALLDGVEADLAVWRAIDLAQN
jgi:NADH-quinone oxidoreductase subunit M